MSASLHEDLLHLVVPFADRDTLVALCLTSTSVSAAASRLLYSSISIHAYRHLVQLGPVLRRRADLAAAVYTLNETCSGFVWDQPYCDDLANLVQSLPNVRFLRIEGNTPGLTGVDRRQVICAVSTRGSLRQLAIQVMKGEELILLDDIPSLDALELSFSSNIPAHVVNLALLRWCHTVRELGIPPSVLARYVNFVGMQAPSMTVQLLRDAYPTGWSQITVSRRLLSAFPALRALYAEAFEADVANIDEHLPHLQHLTLSHIPAGLLTAGHAVSSLAVTVPSGDIIPHADYYLEPLASPHVRTLDLCWGLVSGFSALRQALDLFPGLE
ncbi:hypothetical protein EXIGLDRAFT_230375 [Exidia glandulosa HHB12029]|uniref:F-box domain-containing protein n=1 Tax=Exidia glandulosa HHB12029 TaxID=1314781 RepID=A0A165E669_EXIGL|nr:hypothetical protein EXIGLDRAFT_230375 [Exidia glandulosa HHB12029]